MYPYQNQQPYQQGNQNVTGGRGGNGGGFQVSPELLGLAVVVIAYLLKKYDIAPNLLKYVIIGYIGFTVIGPSFTRKGGGQGGQQGTGGYGNQPPQQNQGFGRRY